MRRTETNETFNNLGRPYVLSTKAGVRSLTFCYRLSSLEQMKVGFRKMIRAGRHGNVCCFVTWTTRVKEWKWKGDRHTFTSTRVSHRHLDIRGNCNFQSLCWFSTFSSWKIVSFYTLLPKATKFSINTFFLWLSHLGKFMLLFSPWPLTLREESRLRVFENRILRRIFGPMRDENGSGEDSTMMNFIVCTVHLI